MEDAKVIYAAERFIERGKQPGKLSPDTIAPVYYLDERREDRYGIIEDIVNQSAASFADILELHGYDEEAREVRERAHQFANEGAPAEVIYEIFNQYLKDKHPDLYKYHH